MLPLVRMLFMMFAAAVPLPLVPAAIAVSVAVFTVRIAAILRPALVLAATAALAVGSAAG